ncbi:cell division protein ZapB [candidate division GN15 bacterium]|nr:cell division protein ZapB [candidate division GN15 bacterium]
MNDKLEQLTHKIETVCSLVESLRKENSELKEANERYRTELESLKKEHEELQLKNADQSEAVRSRLSTVLNRLDELESMAS